MGGTATRTYLEMRSIRDLRPRRAADPEVRIARVHACPASFWRYLYVEVGRSYGWVDRLTWPEAAIRQYLSDPAVSLWLMTIAGAPAGYFELHLEPDGAVEIVYLGLLPEFTGRGLGAHLLTEAAERAFGLGAGRVWLHTCSLDHPAALGNYLARGFAVFRTEEYEVPVRPSNL
jgi:ribosomal protein S18 acetylase RimI-like enzyme